MADRNKNPRRVDRYEDLTNPEVLAIIEGERKDMDGQRNEGKLIMIAGLDLEHFIATLELDPALLTDNQREELLDLRDRFFRLTNNFVKLNILGENGGRSDVLAAATARVQAVQNTPKGS